jgi:hypothetical protein
MAVFPLTPGPTPPAHPDYSGKLIPTLWAKKMLERFYDATVLAAISQTDYEGEIKNYGDTVIINKIPDITISNYRMGDALDVQRPAADTISLLINQGKYWQFIMDDVADVQSMINVVPQWAENASEQMKIVVDTDVLAYLVGKADVDNLGTTAGRISNNINLGVTGTPFLVDKTNVIDYIVDVGTVLDEENTPESSRKLLVPAWMAGLIKKSDLKDASITGDSVSVMRNGRLGMVDRFEIFVSNLLPAPGPAGETYVFGIHPKALTFASQLVKTESLRAESTFGDLMRGLMVYGRQVVQPSLLAEGVVKKGP